MDFLKTLFESGAITWEQFVAGVGEKGYKLADLSTGNYVSKGKYEDDLKAKDTSISDLNTQLATRDTDLTDLQTKLSNAGIDNKTKLTELTNQLTKLQGDYSTVKTDYENKLSKQAYEFAVKDFASAKKFTSGAAKRDFINEMIKQNLTMKDNSILGADDFVKTYMESNTDAFLKEDNTQPTKPSFIKPSNPDQTPDANAFAKAFNFSGVRPHEEAK